MNTILTDDERRELRSEHGWALDTIKLIEAAVLAKLREQEPVAWLVCSINKDGSPSLEYAAAWKEAAHEHINDAITEHEIEEAASWVVRPAYAAPVAAVVQVTPGYKLVPVEPTPEMIHAGRYGGDEDAPPMGSRPVEGETAWPFCSPLVAAKIYRAMLAAAPEAPAPRAAVVQVPQGLIEAVDRVLEEAHCDCPHRLRFDDGEHLSGCPLFDLNVARLEMLAAAPEAPAQNDPMEKLTRIQEELGLYDDQPAQPIPAPWREAVKRLRKNDAAGDTVFRCGFNAGIDAALAQLDALEGGK